jgi:putative FmdB family regulatory protein
MPTYEYRCKSCGEHLEVVQSFKDDALTECPACGGDLRKVFSSIGISFKGSGFYKTDSRTSAKASSNGSSKESAESTSSSSDSSSSSSDSSSTSSSGSAGSSGSSSSSSSSPSSSSSASTEAKSA